MPRHVMNRAQLLESPGQMPLSNRSHYADWLAQSLVDEYLRGDKLMEFSGPAVPYGEAGDLLPTTAPVPSDRTAFYSLAANSTVINPTAAGLKETAHRLVGTGLANEHTLESLSFRVTNLKEPTPDWLRQAEADHARRDPKAQNDITTNEAAHPSLHNSSYSVRNLLNIDEAQAAQFSVDAVDRTTAVFLHELAHAQHSPFDEELKHELAEAMRGAQAWRDNEKGEAAMLFVANAMFEQEPVRIPFFEKNDWPRVAGESYADAYMVVAVHALHGKDAALQTLDSLQHVRTGALVETLERSPWNLYFGEGHHTSEALETLRELIENGSVERALNEGRGRDPVLMATAEGLIREFENMRSVDLNPHTLGPNGELHSGWPKDLQTSAVLSAIQDEWGEVKFGAMVVIPAEQYAQMRAQGEQLRAVSTSGEATEPEVHALPGAPGYVALLTNGLALEHENSESIQQYELQTGAHNLRDDLAQRFGVELSGAENELPDSGSGVSASSSSQGGLSRGTGEVSRRGHAEQDAEREGHAEQAEAQTEAEMEM